MYCRNCSNEVSPQAIACPKCGVPPLKGKNYCNACGTQTHPDAVICVHCGVSLQKPMPMNMNVNIDKRNLLSKWSKLSYSNYVIILLLSLMPFVNFKCQNEKVYNLTGLNLAVGKERKYTETKDYGIYGSHDWERKETIFSLDICLFYVLTLVCLGLLISSYRKKFKYARNITIISLVILVEWFVFTSIRISNTDLGMIEVSFGVGYWLSLIVSILSLILLTYYLKEFKEHELIHQPISTPEPTTQPITQRQFQPIVNDPVISETTTETVQLDETLEYPQSSNKNKYIIGSLIGVIIILGILYLLQREKSAAAPTVTTTEKAVIQEPVQQPINNNPEPSLPKEEEKSNTTNELNQQFGVYVVTATQAFFYNDNKGIEKRKGYVSSGDLVQVGNIDGGYGFAAFISSNDKITKGWINMNDLTKSNSNISVLPDPDKILPAVEVFTFYSITSFEEIKTLFKDYCNSETSSSSEDTFTGYGKNNSCILIQVNKQDGKCKIEYSWQCDSGGH